MRGKPTKKKSKRTTLRKKYKIIRKVKEHERKVKKEKRKHPEKYATKKRKDPGVPNIHPFKAQIIEEARKAIQVAEERREAIKQEIKMRRKDDRENTIGQKRSLSDLLQDVAMRTADFELKNTMQESTHQILTDTSAKAYYKEFRKVVEAADVVLEVLDARDPQGTRCTPMENYVITKAGKKLVLVLNKADLVPKENLKNWLQYLRMEYPTIIFKSSTQSQGKKLSHVKASFMKNNRAYETSNCIGAEDLMNLLKNYCRNKGIKTAITVGVIGLPNVGKSSLINSLKRNKACHVGATPGVTKTLQKVNLDSKISLLDCPGLILPGGDTDDASSCLKNAYKVEKLEDPIPPVDVILKRAGKERLMLHYCLPNFEDTEHFLSLIGKKRGKLMKGGIPNVKASALIVLNDWNSGRLKYFTQPPAVEAREPDAAELVSELCKEFDVFGLSETDEKALQCLPDTQRMEAVCVEPMEYKYDYNFE